MKLQEVRLVPQPGYHLVYAVGAGLIGAATLVGVLTVYVALRYRVRVTSMWNMRLLVTISFIVGFLMGLSSVELWRVPITIILYLAMAWLIRFSKRYERAEQDES